MVNVTLPQQRLISSSVTIGLVTVIMFFVPIVNGVIGGFVGGLRAHDPKTAVLASLVSVLPVAVALYLILVMAEAPVLGVPYVPSTFTIVVSGCVGMPVGAYLGGFVGLAKEPSLPALGGLLRRLYKGEPRAPTRPSRPRQG